jgi:acyl-CoA thioesterase
MWADDHASRAAGFTLGPVALGSAELSMTVRADQVNGLGVCHGGIIFQLADSAMAFASNAANDVSVAASATIDFLAPANLGDHLVARATEIWSERRSASTDVWVTRPSDGKQIALFRGRTRRLGRPVIAET